MQLKLDVASIRMNMPHLTQKNNLFIRQTLIFKCALSVQGCSSTNPSKVMWEGLGSNSYCSYKGAYSIEKLKKAHTL